MNNKKLEKLNQTVLEHEFCRKSPKRVFSIRVSRKFSDRLKRNIPKQQRGRFIEEVVNNELDEKLKGMKI